MIEKLMTFAQSLDVYEFDDVKISSEVSVLGISVACVATLPRIE